MLFEGFCSYKWREHFNISSKKTVNLRIDTAQWNHFIRISASLNRCVSWVDVGKFGQSIYNKHCCSSNLVKGHKEFINCLALAFPLKPGLNCLKSSANSLNVQFSSTCFTIHTKCAAHTGGVGFERSKEEGKCANDDFLLHYGNCRIQHFRSLSHTRG